MLARLYQRRFGIDERKLLEFPMLRRAPAKVPRLLFTHAGDTMRRPEQINLDVSAYAHAKSVLIVRHPGDIAISRFYHLKHRSRDKARQHLASQAIESFVWAEQGGIPSIVTFLNQFAALPGITIIRYEDFLAEPDVALRTLADAIQLDVEAADIADAVEFGSLPNLRQREREGYFTSPRLRPAREGDAKSSKVRSGKSGGYREQLDAADAKRIDDYLDVHLSPVFGYGSGAA